MTKIEQKPPVLARSETASMFELIPSIDLITYRFPRTSREAFGHMARREHFPADKMDVDKKVFIAVIVLFVVAVAWGVR